MGGVFGSTVDSGCPPPLPQEKEFNFPIFKDFVDLSKEKNYGIIPESVLHRICFFLKPSDLIPIYLTCRYFQRAGMSNLFWKRYYSYVFKVRDSGSLISNLNYRKQFFKQVKMRKNSFRKRYYKILVIGRMGVGKTSISNRYCRNKFNSHYKATIGPDFRIKNLVIEEQEITFQVWDTVGQERFQSLGRSFYRGADACVLVFDLTCQESLERIKYWKKTFDEQNDYPDRIKEADIFMVLGNKCDREENIISDQNIKNVLDEVFPKADMKDYFFKTSAKNGTGIDEAFNDLARRLYHRNVSLIFPLFIPKSIEEPKYSGCLIM